MSVIIKDMEMPVDCLACRISCKNEHYLEDGRPFDCPLEEAKTGDLISRADAMARIANDNVVGGMERINEYNNSTEFNDYLDGISDAITTVFCDVPSADITETDGVITIEKQSAKDVGEIKHIIIRSPNYTRYFYNESMPISAEAVHKPDYSYEADMVKRLRAVQEAQATQGWIPCSERLPDVGEIVIASWSDLWSDAIVFARRYCEDDWEWAYEQGSDYWESARDYDRESNPEAWMPLPEPYEPKTERRG